MAELQPELGSVLLAALRQLRERREIGLRIEDQIAGLLGMVVVRSHFPDQRRRHAAFRPALIEANLGVTRMAPYHHRENPTSRP